MPPGRLEVQRYPCRISTHGNQTFQFLQPQPAARRRFGQEAVGFALGLYHGGGRVCECYLLRSPEMGAAMMTRLVGLRTIPLSEWARGNEMMNCKL